MSNKPTEKRKIEFSKVGDPLTQLHIRLLYENLYPKEIKNVFVGDKLKYLLWKSTKAIDPIFMEAIALSSPVVATLSVMFDTSKSPPMDFWAIPVEMSYGEYGKGLPSPKWLTWSFRRNSWYARFSSRDPFDSLNKHCLPVFDPPN